MLHVRGTSQLDTKAVQVRYKPLLNDGLNGSCEGVTADRNSAVAEWSDGLCLP